MATRLAVPDFSTYQPDAARIFQAGQSAYESGVKQRNQNALIEAGGHYAKGDLKGAKNALAGVGDFQGVASIEAMMRAARSEDLERTARINDKAFNMLAAADTPEKYGLVVQALKKHGLDISPDFSHRELMMGQYGDYKSMLEIEALRRKAEEAKYLKVGKDDRLFDPRTNKWIEQPAAAADPDAGLPDELRKALATKDAATMTEFNEASQKAGDVQASLNAIRAQRSKTNWEGPSLFGLRRGIGRIIGGIPGITPTTEETAAMDAMDAEAAKLVQSAASALKGTLSDRDLQLLQSSVPGSQMSDEAAAPIIAGIEAGIVRTQARAEFYDQWIRTHKSGRGFNEAWNRFINERPILAYDEKTGKVTVNPQNATAWRDYLRGGAMSGQRPEGGAARSYQPLPPGGFAATKKPAPWAGLPASPARPAPQSAPPAGAKVEDLSDDDLWGIVLGGK